MCVLSWIAGVPGRLVENVIGPHRLWSLYTMVRTYIGLRVGYLKGAGGSATRLIAMPKAQASSNGAPSGSTSKAGEAVTAARAKCENTQHLACLLGHDLRLKRFVQLIVGLLRPLRMEHGEQNVKNRSPPEAFEYYLGLACCSWMRPLMEMAQQLSDTCLLESIGMTVAWSPQLAVLGLEAVPVIEQDEIAEMAIVLVCNTLFVRTSSQLSHSHALPGVFPKLLAPSATDRASARAFCQECVSAFEQAGEKGKGKAWKTMLARSFMHQTYVQKVLRRLGDFKEDIGEASRAGAMVVCGFRGVGQSKIVEDIIQSERVDSTMRNLNMQMTGKRKWLVAFDTNVVGTKHRFKQVPYRMFQLTKADRARAKVLARRNFYRPAKRKAPQTFRKIVSEKAATSWPSLRPLAMSYPAVDMFLMQHYARTEDHDSLGSAWLAEFFAPGQVLVQRGKHYLVAGSLAKLVLVTFELSVHKTKKTAVYSLAQLGSSPHMLVVDRSDAVEIVPVRWSGTLRQLLMFHGASKKDLGNYNPGAYIAGLPLGKAVPFLKAAALRCFWSIGLPSLQRLCTFLQLERKPATLVEALVLLLRHLAKLGDEAIFEALALRLGKQHADFSDLLDSEAAQEAFEDDPVLKDSSCVAFPRTPL